MTRINCVSPIHLSRQHLIAEYRELPRIFGLVSKAIERGESPDDKRNPRSYTLGPGHCRFFYNKLNYLLIRQHRLVNEMRRRGFFPEFDPSNLGLDIWDEDDWWGYWEPDAAAIEINMQRLRERDPEYYATVNHGV